MRRVTSLSWVGLALTVLLGACSGSKAIIFDTQIQYDGTVYLVREVRRGSDIGTTLYQLAGTDKVKITEKPGAVIHYTADDIVNGLVSKDRLIKAAEDQGDANAALLFRIVRDGEHLGETQAREVFLSLGAI